MQYNIVAHLKPFKYYTMCQLVHVSKEKKQVAKENREVADFKIKTDRGQLK